MAGLSPQTALAYITVALALSAIFTYLAYRYKVITRDALAVSFLVGSSVMVSGPPVLIPFIAFLVTANLVTRLGSVKKEELGVAGDLRGRNWKQALAVGIVPSSLSLASTTALLLGQMETYWSLATAAAACIAYSSADTWASEIGVLSNKWPRLIIKPSLKVPPGVSGGVTLLGELSAIVGSLVVALSFAAGAKAASMVGLMDQEALYNVAVVFALGYMGEVLDSLVGALIQPKYKCPRCNLVVEGRIHSCGQLTMKVSGIEKVSNEAINLVVSITVALTALVIIHWISGPGPS